MNKKKYKKFCISSLTIIIVYSIYLFYWTFNSSGINGLDEIKILSNCSSKGLKTNDRIEKYGFVTPAIACHIRDYYSDDIKGNGMQQMFKVKIISNIGRSCWYNNFVDRKEQLFCFSVNKEILVWFKKNNSNLEIVQYLDSQIKWLNKEIIFNVENPWSKIFPELKEKSSQEIKSKIIWFESLSKSRNWKLSQIEKLQLLGKMDQVTYSKLVSDAKLAGDLQIDDNLFIRISLLKEIFSILDLKNLVLANSVNWFIIPNKSNRFDGDSPKNYIINSNDLKSIFSVRLYLWRLEKEQQTKQQQSKGLESEQSPRNYLD